MKNNVMPSIVLTVICIAASLLLVFVHELTKENIAEQKRIRFNSSVESLFGKTNEHPFLMHRKIVHGNQ